MLQGGSSAVVWTVGMAVLADTLPTEQLGVAMGTVGSVVSLAMVSAPVIGGAVFHTFGYEAVFWVLGGMLSIDVILRLMMIERKDAKQWDIECESDAEDERTGLLENSPSEFDSKSMLTMILVCPLFGLPNEVSSVFNSVMDGIHQRYDPVRSIRCSPSTSSQTNIQLHCFNLRSNVCCPRYS